MPDPDLFLFVSYVREDRQAALEIVAELERRGVPCWIAPRNVHPGKPFDDEIAEAIEACQALLLIFSDRCNEREYIRREITVAGESRKVIIPFRIEDAQPRRGLRVRLSDLHWIDGFVSRERAIDQVVRTIDPARVQQEEKHRQEEERRQQILLQAQRESDQKQEEKEQPQRRRLFRRPTNTIFAIAAAGVLVSLLVMLAVPSPAPKVSTAEALHKGNKAYAEKNYAEAMRWYRDAADQDNAIAQDNVGWQYQKGWGVAQDYAEAMRWYRKAADQGNANAQNNIDKLKGQ